MNANKYKLLLKILVEWSMKNKEYCMASFIYTNFKIGIPMKFLYNLPKQNTFFSLSSFINSNDNIKIDDIYLSQLFEIFTKSKYTQLEEWDNSYGYKL